MERGQVQSRLHERRSCFRSSRKRGNMGKLLDVTIPGDLWNSFVLSLHGDDKFSKAMHKDFFGKIKIKE